MPIQQRAEKAMISNRKVNSRWPANERLDTFNVGQQEIKVLKRRNRTLEPLGDTQSEGKPSTPNPVAHWAYSFNIPLTKVKVEEPKEETDAVDPTKDLLAKKKAERKATNLSRKATLLARGGI